MEVTEREQDGDWQGLGQRELSGFDISVLQHENSSGEGLHSNVQCARDKLVNFITRKTRELMLSNTFSKSYSFPSI